MSGLHLRRGDRADAEGIRTLIESVFTDNPRSDADVLRWQYWENPFGDANVWLWELDGRIVCQQARLPVPVLIGARRERGALSVDSVTASDMQRRGLHGRSRDASNADMCKRALVVGFHYQGPDSMLPSTDAPSAGPIDHHLLPVDAAWLAGRLRLPRAATAAIMRLVARRPGRGAEEVEGVPPDVGALWLELEERFPFGLVKDEAWWRWRYEAHPHRPYRYFAVRQSGRLVGVAAAAGRRVGEVGYAYVLDLLASSGAAASGLVHAIGEAYPDAAAVSMRARPGTFGADLARRAGLFRVPRRWEPSPLTLHVRDTCANRPELLRHPWAVGWGESDHL